MLQHTTMATAFSNSKYGWPALNNGLVTKIAEGLDRYAKSRRAGKSWTARLSFRTARHLASKGVPLQ